MTYSASKIECVRFAGRHPTEGIGCCAIDNFQGFINDPDAPAYVQLKHGDSGVGLIKNREAVYYGPTNKDIFLSYLYTGTFSLDPMPNHAFLLSITKNQLYSSIGLKWLAILKENGFEFIRTIDNSVYSGSRVSRDKKSEATDLVYIFGLFRNIGSRRVTDPFDPPAKWKALPEPSMDDFDRWEVLKGRTHGLTKAQATGAEARPEGPEASEEAEEDYEVCNGEDCFALACDYEEDGFDADIYS